MVEVGSEGVRVKHRRKKIEKIQRIFEEKLQMMYERALSLLMHDRTLTCYEQSYTMHNHLFHIAAETSTCQERR